jgi:hypothetical protein
MKNIYSTAGALARAPLVYLFLLTLALSAASCKRSGTNGDANANSAAGSTTVADETSTTPPFSTKEPERYQATMVITSSLGEQSNIPGMSQLTAKEMLIARDGEKRRVEMELVPGTKVAYLQTATARYMLVPARKVYAEFKPGEEGVDSEPSKNTSSDFSPDALLNQSVGGARYEKLGAENVNGRATVKYRVTMTGKTGEAKSVTTESLIWIDDALGMPVRSETTMSGGGSANSKYSMELRDIKQDVDQSLFELPTDYTKVDYKDIQRGITASVPGTTDKD